MISGFTKSSLQTHNCGIQELTEFCVKNGKIIGLKGLKSISEYLAKMSSEVDAFHDISLMSVSKHLKLVGLKPAAVISPVFSVPAQAMSTANPERRRSRRRSTPVSGQGKGRSRASS